MLEANSIALLNTLSETIDRLTAARDALRDHGSVSVLVEDGHRARRKYEQIAGAAPQAITEVQIGSDGWQEQLRKQAHQAKVWVG